MRGPRLRRWLRTLCISLTVWLIVSWVAAYRLTRRRRPPFPEPIPASVAKGYESIRLRSRDGQDIGAWYRDEPGDGPAVLILHGNGGSRWNSLTRAEALAASGYPVLMISLRAHGDSSGEYNDFGYGAAGDVVAAVEFLEHRRRGRPIVILGTSLGGAAALFASRELGHRVRGYVLESPYRDLRTAVWNRLDDALPPVLDWVIYRGLLAVSPAVLPHLDQISPFESAGHVPADVPVLILAGEDDRRARPDEARAILGRLRGHAELMLFQGAGHLRMREADPVRYRNAVLGFLERVALRNK